jgi:hypothetical protein
VSMTFLGRNHSDLLLSLLLSSSKKSQEAE